MNIFHHKPSLLKYNTFGLQAGASYWAEFDTTDGLNRIIAECNDKKLPWYIISGGSNIILTGNFPGVYIHPTGTGIEISDQTPEHVTVTAQAGVVWDDLVAWSVDHSLGGLENLSYIPGMVGASPVQNIGAYGAEAKDSILWVEWFDTENMSSVRTMAEDCAFGYRDSIFKGELRGRAIVTSVAFRLSRHPKYNIRYGDLLNRVNALGGTSDLPTHQALSNIRKAVIEIRREKLPDPTVTGNAGSFFKNPVITATHASSLREHYPDMPSYPIDGGSEKIPAGWLIDRAGWKGFRSGDVGVHPAQALVIVNYGSATASEILNLATRIIADIKKRFDIELSMEVNIL